MLKEKISTATNLDRRQILIVDKDIKTTLMSNEGISASAMGVPMVLKLKDVLAAKDGQEITLQIKDLRGDFLSNSTIN